MANNAPLELLDKAPQALDEMPAWLTSLDDKQLDCVWVSALTAIVQETVPNADLSAFVRSCNIVRERMRGNQVKRPRHRKA